MVHTQELGQCFQFKDARPFSAYPPFTYEGAPPSAESIGAAFYADGLWIFGHNGG